MLSSTDAISRLRRDLTIGFLVKSALILAALAVPVLQVRHYPVDGLLALSVIGAVGVVLGLQSVRSGRLMAESPSLIAAGRFDAAEQAIVGALHSFSIFRRVKLLTLHHLAALRHAQGNFRDAAALCRALLGQLSRQQRGRSNRTRSDGLNRSTQLMLADSLLELNDARGAGDMLRLLYQQRLSLGEALSMMLVQLDYESRVNAWPQMMHGVRTKVSMAELMPAAKGARTQALLALAANRVGRDDWSDWLRRRAELLVDSTELIEGRPMLNELWP